jgi:putative heme-binding domain-containing protein
LTAFLITPVTTNAQNTPPKEGFDIRQGDHIAVIGNTLPDRMQHDGWLETQLQTRFPTHELVVRDLGFSGDELTIRLRSANFGTPDQHLTIHKADVIFAFFGYNESFAGRAGLDKFKTDLDSFLKHTLAQKYNGKSAPRIVLCSPIAHEDLHNPHLPDGQQNNARLKEYTSAMAEVAKTNYVAFVDLFTPTVAIYRKATKPLTINGVHLNSDGNAAISLLIDEALFPKSPRPSRDSQTLEKVRQAVLDKNFYWFNRYRTVDGYSIFGGRADLAFTDGQTNRVVAQREMQVLDVMTANRDKRIWAAAQGKDHAVDDSNTPPFIPVKTNKPGPGPNGENVLLDGEEAIKKMTTARGMRVNLFASEKEFPALAKPVQMSFDAKGRLWVAAWPSYPHWKPKEEMNDKILILEDTDGDGKADKETVFADHLHCPTGFEFFNGGVYVAQAPDLFFLKDTNGDDRADVRERVLSGLDSADTHHTANSFVLDPGGALYFQEGTFHHTQVETPYGPPVRCANAGVFRYEPRTQKFEVHVSYAFANPHGHVFDRWGQEFVTDGTGNVNYYATAFSGHIDFPAKHPGMDPFFPQRTRPCPATEFLSSRHFPPELQGVYLVANVIGFQGIHQYKVRDDEPGYAVEELEPLVYSTDPNFRPSDIEIGPDGAIYFLDWQNPIIGHMQHNLRDPNRDRTHGRIYRVTYEARPLLGPVTIAGQPVAKVLDLLKEPEDRVRYRARIELSGRKADEVIAGVKAWIAGLDKNDPEYEHHMLEALWVHQSQDVVDVELLTRILHSPDFRARAAATRVLCYWRDRVPNAIGLLKTLAADASPRVRLEAVRAASFFTDPEAVEIPLISAEYSSDYYLNYTRTETMKTLEPYWRKAVAEGRAINVTSDTGARYLLRNVNTDDLLRMKRNRGVDLELIFRRGLRDEVRREALADLATIEKKPELRVLIDAIRSQDERKGAQDESVVFDLVRLLTGRSAAELTTVRDELVKMAISANLSVTRQLGFVALIAADGSAERAWDLATKSAPALRDLLAATPLIRDPSLRAGLYPKIAPLLEGLPKSLASASKTGTEGRYVRIELPGRRTLTLAEVQVMSNGRNVAPQGKASQKNTSGGGEAKRAIDGNTSGEFGQGGQTHTEENTQNPWWELDLGDERPIESVIIFNRTDGPLGQRLNGFTLKVLDKARNPVAQLEHVPAPVGRGAYDVGGGGTEGQIRRAAMLALTSMRGHEADAFKAIARFARDGVDRQAAVTALQRIPAAEWPKEEAQPLLDSILAYIRKLPVSERTSQTALDSLQLGDALAATLPLDQARQIRKELGALGVRVIRIGTITDQMLYDKERFVVQAGKPFEIVFENNDLMPHNLVITRSGSLEEIGLLGEATATDPRALERNYVPVSDKILLSSRLLQPRESQKLSFTAPTSAGVFPYVCTYPGHWRRMFGAMYVVDDLEQYLADSEGYLAAHPVKIADELLKFNRPRKEWKFDDLASSVEPFDHNRSFSNGKQLFTVANCVACHKLNGVGNEIGPDLAKLDPKLKPTDILRDVLEPSFKINEKFTSAIVETQDGKVITGLVLEETPEMIKLVENPLLKSQPLMLKKSEIAERKKSPTSIMPQALMDKFTREEILDLIAYVVAGGNPQNAIYQGGHNHGSGH